MYAHTGEMATDQKKSGTARGSIISITGCMCSGKTTEMKRRVRLQAIAKRKCVLVKYAKDTRYLTSTGDKARILTHDEGLALEEKRRSPKHEEEEWDPIFRKMPVLECCKLEEIETQLSAYDVIGVDEVQFMSDAATLVDRLATQGKTVITAGLNSTHERKPFPIVAELEALAEERICLHAVCLVCGQAAHYSKKIANLHHTETEDLGGLDKYLPVCRACFHAKS